MYIYDLFRSRMFKYVRSGIMVLGDLMRPDKFYRNIPCKVSPSVLRGQSLIKSRKRSMNATPGPTRSCHVATP